MMFAGSCEQLNPLCIECLRWVHTRCSGISGKLKSNVDFHCRRCLEGKNVLFQSVLLKEVEIEPNVKLECVLKVLLFVRHTWCRRMCERQQQELFYPDSSECTISHKGKDIHIYESFKNY